MDGFQGRGKEAVVMSLVRSNPEHEVGFQNKKLKIYQIKGLLNNQLSFFGNKDGGKCYSHRKRKRNTW